MSGTQLIGLNGKANPWTTGHSLYTFRLMANHHDMIGDATTP
jgi:hypothetical protein